MAGNDVVYRYKKNTGVIYGIPARDLTQADVDRLTLEQQRDVKAGTLYTAVSKSSDQKSSDAGKGDGKKGDS